jgi:hypothetical protein
MVRSAADCGNPTRARCPNFYPSSSTGPQDHRSSSDPGCMVLATIERNYCKSDVTESGIMPASQKIAEKPYNLYYTKVDITRTSRFSGRARDAELIVSGAPHSGLYYFLLSRR